jgi:N-acyl-D-amino-acid deacylase
MFDLLITGCRVLDGTGAPWYWGDVAVQKDRIVATGQLDGAKTNRIIDADGCILSPGFIDIHAHSDLQPLAYPLQECKIRQGVTTEVIGHDGLGLAPVTPETAAMLRKQLAGWNGDPDIEWDWGTITTYLDRFDEKVAVNVAMLVPHGTIRMAVMGMDNRAPTPSELSRMQQMVEQAMREGAIGLSTGLTYAPAMFSEDDELVQLCKVMQPYNGFYAPHHRNYGVEALKGYADSIEIGRNSGVPVHLTHCHLGFAINKARAPELLALIDQARAENVEVTLDSYPYLAGATYLHANLPSWMHEGGTEATLGRLASKDILERLQHEMEVTGSDGVHGVPLGWEMLQIGSILVDYDSSLEGMFLPEAAERAGQTPFQFFVELLINTRLSVSCLVHFGNEENVQAILQHPAYMVCSDGILVGERPHPRGWGSHVRFLVRYVRDLGLLTWEEGVRRMTSAPARRIGALDRGLIRPGMKADLVLFDPDTLQDTATYEKPKQYPEGVMHVLVNGQLVVEEGEPTGATPGRSLREPFGRRPERLTEIGV